MYETLTLCFFALLAGFIDSVVGGGGLIQLPALLVTLPQYSVQTLIGTGKLPGFTGSVTASILYGRHVQFNWRLLIITSIVSFCASFIGSSLVNYLDSRALKPVILVLLIIVAIYTFIKKDFGKIKVHDVKPSKSIFYGILIGIILGFYDGFFGPGTGSFLVLAFIILMGFDFIHASAHAKVVNAVTNFASVIVFASHGNILYQYAIPMAILYLTGATIGSRMAILRGNAFVRVVFLSVISLMIVRYGYDIFFK
jgi:uncharacterized protein